jgi:hypothetical protein
MTFGTHGHNHRQFTRPGEYAGRAVFRPHHKRDLKEGLFQSIGLVVEVEFAGVASRDEQFAGQNLYQERRGELLMHSWVPEEDLEFIDEPAPAAGAAASQPRRRGEWPQRD